MKACSGWFSTTIKLFVNFLAVSRSFQQIYYVIIFCCVNILKAVHFVIVVAVLPHTRRATCFSFLLVLFADCCYFAIGWSRHWCQVITRQVIYAKKVSIPPGSPDAAAAARALVRDVVNFFPVTCRRQVVDCRKKTPPTGYVVTYVITNYTAIKWLTVIVKMNC